MTFGDVEPNRVVVNCWTYGGPLLVVWWIEHDSAQTRYRPAFHYPLFVFLVWPVAVPHYVLRTRGWRGMGLALALLAAICAPLLGGVVGALLKLAGFLAAHFD